jgi:hypothetical protein
MAELAEGGGGDGEISNVRKKGPIYLSLFPASKKNDFLLFFPLLTLGIISLPTTRENLPRRA